MSVSYAPLITEIETGDSTAIVITDDRLWSDGIATYAEPMPDVGPDVFVSGYSLPAWVFDPVGTRSWKRTMAVHGRVMLTIGRHEAHEAARRAALAETVQEQG